MTHAWSNAIDLLCWVIVLPTLAWLGYRSFGRSANRAALVAKWIASLALLALIHILTPIRSPFTPIMVGVPAVLLGVIWAPSIGSMLARPLTGVIDGGDEETEAKPFYFIAEAKRQKGLYEEAMAEVRRQLEKFPGDYEGYTKLASIQMENLNDLPAAQATLNEFLDWPERRPNEVAGALHLLADWQLQFGRDAQAALASLQRIVEHYPETSLAHVAEQRIARLGAADETHRVLHEATFKVAQRERNLGLRQETAPAATPADPHLRAEEYVKQLELHPTDTATREKLAILYAEEFHRMDMAADQLEQMIGLPTEPPKHVAHWLNLLATLHIKVAHDGAAAESALRRIIERFPGGAPAIMATSRLASLQGELKALEKGSTKTLGAYEKNLGLKQSQG
jgi:hypothetical protein